MVALPVWIESWVCECCGVLRRVGESVDLALTFIGEITSSTDPDRIDVLPGGGQDAGQAIRYPLASRRAPGSREPELCHRRVRETSGAEPHR
jgi:hypothetical protein